MRDTETLGFTDCLRDAKRFETSEEALSFAYGDRVRRGNTQTQSISPASKGIPFGVGMPAPEARYLGLEITSVLENTRLYKIDLKR